MSSEDDDVPQLSADTLAALLAFQTEQQEKDEALRTGKCDKIDEDWQVCGKKDRKKGNCSENFTKMAENVKSCDFTQFS